MTEFKDFGLNPNILSSIEELGFVNPTLIQELIIPEVLSTENDIIGLAQTGTGKTAAFGLPLIDKLDLKTKYPQLLVLSPTRELCVQISKDLEKYSKNISNIKIATVYGGANITTQIKDLKEGSHIVVGTPGRVLDLINRKVLKIDKINFLVLDEADEMLNMGFKEDLDNILETTNKDRRTLLFSATMPKEIRQIAGKYMKNPIEISAGKKNESAENVFHEYYVVMSKDKYLALKRIVDVNPKVYGIIFCRTRQETKDIAEKLFIDGYNSDALHGDLTQGQRDYVMKRFRNRQLQLLVATDVAARGIDVTDLTHIINYSLPDEIEIYIHRSGRTGRAGKKGISISIIHSREINKIKQLEKLLKKPFNKKLVPNGKEICEKQLFNLIDKIEKIEVNEEQIESYLEVIYKKLEWLSREDLIKRFVSVEFSRFLEYYKDAEDINYDETKSHRHERDDYSSNDRRRSRGDRRERNDFSDNRRRGDDSDSRRRGDFNDRRRNDDSDGRRRNDDSDSRRKGNPNINFSRIFINIGSNNSLNPGKLLEFVNTNVNKRGIEIGHIDIMKSFSFFEVDTNFEQEIINSIKNKDFNGVIVSAEIAKPRK